ncbi:MarR family winged helix-turn-helix transcriptional regulator [Spirillospora sp. NPDC048911]|uniref:MarR family winged helix-turn-helix transcriptional regulator n=1 Tax=Spirillospora sp. NPDC048911 TaxID=3364527 RepID=UPI0037154064
MNDERPDLAAMLVPLGRTLMAIEEPVLKAHDVSMWAYVVLNALDERPVRNQSALAQAIGADKTRIIGDLDALQARGLIRREPDPADRRAHLLSLTPEGRQVRNAIRTGIQERENRLLDRLPEDDRHAFLRALQTLHTIPRDEILREP